MKIEEYFRPVDLSLYANAEHAHEESLLNSIKINATAFPDLENIKIAIIGVEESRGASPVYDAKNCVAGIRSKLYELKKHSTSTLIADLGDFIPGSKHSDSLVALTLIIKELIQKKIIPVLIGASQDITFAHYMAYKQMEQIINIVSIDSRFDLGTPAETLNASTWLGKIVLDQPNFLFNYSNIGHQTYFVGSTSVDMMDKLYFETYRLGNVKSNMREMEPVIRNADLISFDLSAMKQGDAPAAVNASPNGLTGEEACQLMQYAGMSDKLSGIGFYNYESIKDVNLQTASLMSQMIWYFIEGCNNRIADLPEINQNAFTIYNVTSNLQNQELMFLKSNKTGRWWVEIPIENSKRKITRHHFMPCSESDYETALKNEIPERWWQALKKIS